MKKLKNKISNKMLIFFISIFLGLQIGVQTKTVENMTNVNLPYTRGNIQNSSDIKKLRDENKHLENDIKKMKEDVKRHEKDILTDEETLEVFDEIDKYSIMCGFEELVGPGIIIEINDLYDDYFYNFDTQVLNDKRELLFKTINLLRISGVEAIAVNDIRVTNYTEMELAGIHFEINSISTNTPFVIKAIGDIESLYNGVEVLKEDSFFDITITKEKKVLIPKSNKAKEFKYVNPIEKIRE